MAQARHRSRSSDRHDMDIDMDYEHVDTGARRGANDGSPVLRVTTLVSVGLVLLFFYMVAMVPRDICVDKLGPLNRTYPLTAPKVADDGTVVYRIAIVTDRDLDSKSPDLKNTWIAYMKYGQFSYNPATKKASVKWDAEVVELKSTLAQGGRAMELSDLKVFDGYMHSVDDRTGVVYRHINKKTAIPFVILADGDGTVTKGLKGEWIATKDEHMYVGGLGKEWTTTKGEFQNYNPMWVKRVSRSGHVEHLDWVEHFKAVRRAAGIEYPGYMIHESVQWSDIHQQWFFLPRRASNEMYTEADDEHRGTNLLVRASEDFQHVTATHVTPLTNTRGFSAFQFIPGTRDQVIVALKSEEDRGTIRSYITVFTIDNEILLEETLLDLQYKFEGVEFV